VATIPYFVTIIDRAWSGLDENCCAPHSAAKESRVAKIRMDGTPQGNSDAAASSVQGRIQRSGSSGNRTDSYRLSAGAGNQNRPFERFLKITHYDSIT
jgi:hypothetical protein